MKRSMKILTFRVLIEQDEHGLYAGSVPELPGCYTQGRTIEELRKRIREVIELTLESDASARKEKLSSPVAPSRFFGIEEMQIHYA